MYNSLKTIAWVVFLVVFVSVGMCVVNGLSISPMLPGAASSWALIPNSSEGNSYSARSSGKPSDQAVKAAIVSVLHPLPAPEEGYELNGIINGSVEILRQSDFDEIRQELRVAALVTADVSQTATRAPSPFDKSAVLRCRYSLVEYYRINKDRSGNWTAHRQDSTRRPPQMQCRN